MSIEKILDYLNAARVRCTYKAVGEALGGVPAQCVAPCFLGERRKKASWVVKAETGQPTGYTSDQKHPQLEERECIIRSGAELEKCMRERRWIEDRSFHLPFARYLRRILSAFVRKICRSAQKRDRP